MARDTSNEQPLEVIKITTLSFWESNPPMVFFKLLQKNPKGNIYIIGLAPPSDWIDAIDTVLVNKFVNSDEPASIVASLYESNMHKFGDTTTLGKQARFLKEGFKSRKYPPSLCSFHHFN